MFFRNPQLLWLLLALIPFAAIAVWRRGRVPLAATLLRLVIVGLLGLALAEPLLAQQAVGGGDALVLLVDQSDSLGSAGKAALRERAAGLVQAARADGREARALLFGADVAAADLTVLRADMPGLDATATDLAGALRAGGALVGPGGRLALLSDGLATSGDALGAARELAARSVAVDTFTLAGGSTPEVWLTGISAPETIRAGEPYALAVTVGASGAATGKLQILDGETPLFTQDVSLRTGPNLFNFTPTALRAGVARLRAVVQAQPDTLTRNNAASTTALVYPPPTVLLVEGAPAAADLLAASLQRAGVESKRLAPRDLPARLAPLDPFDGVVLVDVSAGDLSLDQMATLREFVRSEGRGLVATGGRSSLTVGGYKGTPLEEVLPVTMEPKPRPDRSDVSLLLLIDRSASMGVPDNPSKLDMAKEAAILAAEGLRENDRIGVLTFDSTTTWAIPFQAVGGEASRAALTEEIGKIGLGGGTDILDALRVGLAGLAQQPTKVRHAVLLTDGRSSARSEAFQQVVAQARAASITVSAIAVGEDADEGLLRNIAQAGAGRFHLATRPEELPRLTLLESEIARADPLVEGNFAAAPAQPHPILNGVDTAALPELGGFVGTTLKPAAELALKAPDDDPLLAVWQYGLGRAATWTASVGAPWASSWESWTGYGPFWAQVIRYTLPAPDAGPLRVRLTARGNDLLISADAIAPSGAPLDLADTQAVLTLPGGQTRTLTLRQVGPGRYETLVAPPSDGPYAVEVRQRKGDLIRSASSGYARSYPAEYAPADAARGAALLAEISKLTGGTALGAAASSIGSSAPVTPPTELWVWLVASAALLLPLELYVRRRAVEAR